jgi:hypothetical protein
MEIFAPDLNIADVIRVYRQRVPSAGVSLVVMAMARSDGRSGSDGIRRYNFDSIAAAMRRFELESVNHQVHRVELLTIIASRTVSR